MKATSSEFMKIKGSKIHGKGAFAIKPIPKGTDVIEYVGKKITKAQSDKIADRQYDKAQKSKTTGSVYIFELNKRYDIDGNVKWNTARLINHSCNPNCEVIEYDRHMWIVSMRRIKKGEEITYNYNFPLQDYQDAPCKCGSPKCLGYMVDDRKWKALRKRIRKDKARAKKKAEAQVI